MADSIIDAALKTLEQDPIQKDFGESPGENEEHCDKPGTTDDGVFKVASIRRAIALGTAGINLLNAYKMASLQDDIADKYASIAERYRRHYLEEYKPLEIQNLKEVEKLPKYDRKKEGMVRGQMILSVRDHFAGKIEDTLSCSGRYCTGVRAAAMNELLTQQAAAEAATAALAHRHIDNEEIVHNEHRWERRRGVLDTGRDIPTQAIGHAQLAAGVFGSIGAQSGKAAEGALWGYRYEVNRRETIYNEDRPPLQYREREFDLGIRAPQAVKKVEYVQPAAMPKFTINLPETPKPAEKKEEPKQEVELKPNG